MGKYLHPVANCGHVSEHYLKQVPRPGVGRSSGASIGKPLVGHPAFIGAVWNFI